MTLTCQCCSRAIKLVGSSIAHHGYRRLRAWGGHQTASCMGARFLPYEQSRDRLADLLGFIQGDIERLRDSVAAMLAEPKPVIIRHAARGRPAVMCNPSDPLYRVRVAEWHRQMAHEVTAAIQELQDHQARYDAWTLPADKAGDADASKEGATWTA